MLFFKTNMDRTEQCDCSIIYNLHIQLKHWQGGSAGEGRIKNHNKKHPEADQSGVQITSPTGFHWKRGITASVWADGLNNGTNLYRNRTVGAQNGKVMMGGDFLSQTGTRGGDPTHQDRQHHNSLLVCFLCVSVFLFSFKFYQEVLQRWSGFGGDHSASHL